MSQIKFTAAEKKYMDMIGADNCLRAYHVAEAGNGAKTIGEDFLHKLIDGRNYTKAGDCIINAGRKLHEEKVKTENVERVHQNWALIPALPIADLYRPIEAKEKPNPFAILSKIICQPKLF